MNKKVLKPATSASFNKRISLKGIPDLPEAIPQNDDDAEREQRRRNSGKFGQLAGLQVSLGGITELSASELVAQYTNCMRLSAENKINHKNAFSLPLIDCMKLLLKKKDEQMNNFQVVGCTLDASAKIYASRVDRVHMDGMSFAKDLGGRSRDLLPARSGSNDDDESEEENAAPTKKKRHKKRILSKDVSKINVQLDVTEPDPTYVVLRKQFSNCQPTFISFMPRLNIIDDSSRVSMDMRRSLISKNEDLNFDKEINVEFECNIDGNYQIVQPSFRDFLIRDIEEIAYDSLLHGTALDNSLLDDDDPMDDDIENDVNDDYCDPFDENTVCNGDNEIHKDDSTQIHKTMSSWNGVNVIEVGTTRLARGGPRERVVDIQEAILKQVKEGVDLEYTYMNLDRILFAGPKHWGPLPVSRVLGKNNTDASDRNKKKEKKVDSMDFSLAKEVEMPSSRSCTLTASNIENNWTTDKVTNPADLHMDPKSLLKFFNWPVCSVNLCVQNSRTIPPEEEDEDVNDYDYDNLNDSQQFCPAPVLEQESEGPENCVDTVCDGELQPAADVHSCESADTNSDKWTMIEPPNKVARIAVPYAQHAKKIDMKVLKAAIWKVLSKTEINLTNDNLSSKQHKKNSDDKQKKIVDDLSGITMTGERTFSDLDKCVMNIVPCDMAQELTMPLIFTALLHLANEKILTLHNLDDHSDIIISQDIGAESFVRGMQQRKYV